MKCVAHWGKSKLARSAPPFARSGTHRQEPADFIGSGAGESRWRSLLSGAETHELNQLVISVLIKAALFFFSSSEDHTFQKKKKKAQMRVSQQRVIKIHYGLNQT